MEISQCSSFLPHRVCYRLVAQEVGRPRLDSERFRSAPRTCRPPCGRLKLRMT